jgi:hypothetical protein
MAKEKSLQEIFYSHWKLVWVMAVVSLIVMRFSAPQDHTPVLAFDTFDLNTRESRVILIPIDRRLPKVDVPGKIFAENSYYGGNIIEDMPVASPDGKWVITTRLRENSNGDQWDDVYLKNTQTEEEKHMYKGQMMNGSVSVVQWSPDSTAFAFQEDYMGKEQHTFLVYVTGEIIDLGQTDSSHQVLWFTNSQDYKTHIRQ